MINPKEYMAGASAGKRKLWWAFRIPITSPLKPKITAEGSWMRSSWAVRISLSGLVAANAGARITLTTWSANIVERIASTVRIRVTQLARAEAKRQAPERSFCERRVDKVGMKAEPSAPPATRLKRISEKRLAAKKASLSMPVPKERAIKILASRLAIWLRIMATIIVPAARAIWRLAELFRAGIDILLVLYVLS